MHRIRYVSLAATLAAGLSACSVYEDMTTSDFAKQDADAIVAAASKAMRGVSSMRLTGQVRSKGTQVFIDVRMDRDDRCTGTIRLGGGNIDIRRLEDRAWVKGEAAAYNRLSTTPLRAPALERLSSSWLPVDDKALLGLCDLDSLLEGFEVVDYGSDASKAERVSTGKGKGAGDLDDRVPASVGEESSSDGQKVVPLSGNPGGLHEEVTWVLSEAPHYVVRIESTSARDGGEVSLSEFDEDVLVEAPRPADVLRP